MVLVVILGRTGRTEFNFPATIAALVVNVALNLLLVPPLGIVGAGLALVASYLVVVGADVRASPSASSRSPTSGAASLGWCSISAALVGARRTADADLRRRRPRSAASSSSPPTRWSSSPAASSPPSERGWLARLRHPGELARRGSSALRAAPSRGRRPRPRGLRGRAAWTNDAPLLSRLVGAVRGCSRRARGGAPGGRGPGRRRAGRPGRTAAATARTA